MTFESTDDRLPTSLWVDAHLHQLTLKGIPYYIANKGSYASGTVMLKLSDMAGQCLVLQQQRDLEGVMGWMTLFDGEMVADDKADAYIQRAVNRDPDLWVIEIEDRDLVNPFEGPVF